MFNSEKRIEIITYILYAISNFLMILNPGAFWDDWALYGMHSEGIMSQFRGNGITVFGYIHIFLKEFSGSPVLYHCLTFLLQILLVYSLFRLINSVVRNSGYRLFLVCTILLFAFFPHYDSKITMIVFPYTLCLTLFTIGTLFLFKFRENKKVYYRLLALLFFFLSFFTNSLLFFYVVPLFFAFFFESFSFPLSVEKVKGWIYVILRRIDFFLLPIVFWIMRLFYFMPSQQYVALGYNEVKLETLLQIPYRIAVLLYIFVMDLIPFIKEASQYLELWIVFLIVVLGAYFALSKVNLEFKINWKMLGWGFVIFLIGAFPYLMVNKYPTYIDYFSRHQLLIGFGASLSCGALVFLLRSSSAKRLILSILLGAFVSLNVLIQFSFFKGYMKQEVFQDFFTTENISSDISQTILLEDSTENFTKKGNPVKFYAFAGMLKQQNSKENIFIIQEKKLEHFLEIGLFEMIGPYTYQYNIKDYEYTPPTHKLLVNYSQKERPMFPLLKYYSQFLSGDKNKWNQYFTMEIVPLENWQKNVE